MRNLSTYLRQFAFLSPDLDQAVNKIVVPDPRTAKELYWKPGRGCPYIWYLESGLLCIYEINEGKEAFNWIQEGPGVFIEPVSSLGRRPYSRFYIQPIESCVAHRAEMQDLYDLIILYPEFSTHYALINQYYREVGEKHKSDLLSLDARERLAKLVKEHPDWPKRIPHRILWQYLGMAKNTFLKLRGEFGL